jgi:hypothetical protein
VIVAVAVLDLPMALARVNWKLALPVKSLFGVKVTFVAGNPLTVPPTGVPTRAAEVGLPLAPLLRSIGAGTLATVVAVSFTAVGATPFTVIVAVAVFDVPLALASVNWKLAVPLNPVLV